MRISVAIVATAALISALPATAAENGFTIRTAGELAALCAGEPESGVADKATGLDRVACLLRLKRLQGP